jgi:hypothetical protein
MVPLAYLLSILCLLLKSQGNLIGSFLRYVKHPKDYAGIEKQGDSTCVKPSELEYAQVWLTNGLGGNG